MKRSPDANSKSNRKSNSRKCEHVRLSGFAKSFDFLFSFSQSKLVWPAPCISLQIAEIGKPPESGRTTRRAACSREEAKFKDYS